ncbi:MAG: AbrB/MazE/SpoVT family DNA-binding domain-containing protein [Methanothrix sp.]|nr:AbrB/MazE/SpoVT family DNA-binding domain-containing protein [Methanothrix sp.]
MNGLITNIDTNGRIQLPLAIRYGLHLLPGDKIAVDQLGDGTIILKKIEEQEILAAVEMSEIGIKEAAHS